MATPHRPQNLTMGLTEWLLLLALAFVWGGSFFFGEVALDELPPLSVLMARVGIAAIALNLVVIFSGQPLSDYRRWWGAFLVMGLVNNLIPFGLILWGQTYIASGFASILNATTPLFTVLLAHGLTQDERLTGAKVVGVLAGLVGVAVMIGPTALRSLDQHLVGEIAILGAAFSYGLATIWGRRFRELPPTVTATGQVTGSTVMALPLFLIIDQPWTLPAPGAVTWGSLAGLSLTSTALAYLMYFRILKASGASNVALVTLLVPVFAVALGVGILGEVLSWRQVAGMVLIGLGLAAIDGRLARWVRSRKS